ncbi:MAG: 1-acyl-sn-glycerol-3-phosphate acyltransferase [Pyrinomonadaceae bacterium]|nr:1-acyl-sn-glycerol-3-phosphate acyltransferase [Pyrinomonadaceae bacterium]MCX7639591.1 1-acyl-sn-glycerol-3-phosphate acyltransferase [Pyrinomonadaceae bacterium]MDW8303984.1 lysophospholipid acyltransferase family protein [Acidobacteriota bacterium]
MRYALVIIRLIVFVTVTLGLYFIWLLGKLVIPNKPFWRQIMFRLWAKSFAKIAGMKIEVIGEPPKPPFFLISNHLGYVDIPLLRSVVDGVFVAKSEIRDWFLAGKIAKDMETIFINRQNRRDILRAGEKILERLNAGEGVIVFPEGTSTKGESVLKFRSSFLEFPARTAFPVHYVAITYRTPNNNPPANTICWWGDENFIEHIWKLFQIPRFEAVLKFGESPIHNPDRKELARILWEKVNEKFVPVL